MARLTEEQKEQIKKLYISGKNRKEIKNELGISYNTVRSHVDKLSETLHDKKREQKEHHHQLEQKYVSETFNNIYVSLNQMANEVGFIASKETENWKWIKILIIGLAGQYGMTAMLLLQMYLNTN